MNADCVIVGGGIQGCATAVHLALRGVGVILVEKNYCGRHASGVNAGGVMRPARRPEELPLSTAAMEIWHSASVLVDDDCGFRACGRLKIAQSETEMAELAARFALVRRLGYGHEQLLDRGELRAIEPEVAGHACGAVYSPACGIANPFRSVEAYKRKAVALGARILEGTRVGEVRRQAGHWRVRTDAGEIEAPALVNTAGAWGDRLAAATGDPVEIHTIAPMLMVTSRMAPWMRQRIGAVNRVLSIAQFPNGTVIIGGGYLGTADRDAETTTLDYAKLAFNARIACEMFPRLREVRLVHHWAGIEGATTDGFPIIGPSASEEGAFHAFAFCAHGFHLGPAVGRVLADLVVDGSTRIPIEAFRIDRFKSAAKGGA